MNFFNRQKHPLEDQIKALSDRDEFLDILDWIAAGRETSISALKNSPEGRIREISGRIQAYDEILNLCGYQDMLVKRVIRRNTFNQS
jgi:hypothetical protein